MRKFGNRIYCNRTGTAPLDRRCQTSLWSRKTEWVVLMKFVTVTSAAVREIRGLEATVRLDDVGGRNGNGAVLVTTAACHI